MFDIKNINPLKVLKSMITKGKEKETLLITEKEEEEEDFGPLTIFSLAGESLDFSHKTKARELLIKNINDKWDTFSDISISSLKYNQAFLEDVEFTVPSLYLKSNVEAFDKRTIMECTHVLTYLNSVSWNDKTANYGEQVGYAASTLIPAKFLISNDQQTINRFIVENLAYLSVVLERLEKNDRARIYHQRVYSYAMALILFLDELYGTMERISL